MELILISLLPLLALYFLIRLNWIKQLQMVILLRSPVIYISLPPLKTMMFGKWWVWNDTYFLPNPEDLRSE